MLFQVRGERNILEVQKHTWIPDRHQQDSIMGNVMHWVIQALVKYIDFLKPLKCHVSQYIPHEFIEKTRQKSVCLNCELIEESENSASGMITILERVHQLAVPHVRQDDKKVIERVVFGGDVLTNERAFTAQQNMQLNKSEMDRLAGIIHRPEGLHRQMNFLLVIVLHVLS